MFKFNTSGLPEAQHLGEDATSRLGCQKPVLGESLEVPGNVRLVVRLVEGRKDLEAVVEGRPVPELDAVGDDEEAPGRRSLAASDATPRRADGGISCRRYTATTTSCEASGSGMASAAAWMNVAAAGTASGAPASGAPAAKPALLVPLLRRAAAAASGVVVPRLLEVERAQVQRGGARARRQVVAQEGVAPRARPELQDVEPSFPSRTAVTVASRQLPPPLAAAACAVRFSAAKCAIGTRAWRCMASCRPTKSVSVDVS